MNLINLSLQYRYFITCFILLLLIVSHTINGQWVGDFWEHSAVIRELATNPLSPKHPQLLLDAPHAFYSPYSLAVAYISRIARVDAITMLAMVGVVNLLFFLFSLRVFGSMLSPKNAEATTFYALLFTLLLWGHRPWAYGGFFHLRVLGYVLPYPSTFAISLTFVTISIFVLYMRNGNRLWFVAICLASIVVLLSHPLSFIFLGVGLVSVSLGMGHYAVPDIAKLVCLFIITFLVTLVWPYYPFIDLILSETNIYHPSNCIMYTDIFTQIYPALVGIPCLIYLYKSKSASELAKSLFPMFVLLSFVYICGISFAKWSYGRTISSIVFILHISLATVIAQAESNLDFRFLPHRFQKLIYTSLVVIILIAFSFNGFVRPVLSRSIHGGQNRYQDQFRFLSDFAKQYDVVLSDIFTSTLVPTFGGKTVAVDRPLAFIPDHDRRKQDIEYFYLDTTPHSDRLEIVQKYKVNFLLINKSTCSMWQKMTESMVPPGRIEFENSKFVLIFLPTAKQVGDTSVGSVPDQ